MSLERDLEQIVIDAINADVTIPASLGDMEAVHGRTDEDAPLGAIAVEAKVGEVKYEGGFPFECEVTVATRVPILAPDDDGNAQVISAEDEDALWESVDEILKAIHEAGSGALAHRLTWLGTKSKAKREDGDKFRHRSRMIPCLAR